MHSPAAAPAPEPHAPSDGQWTALERFAFGVALVYFTLDALPDLLIALPGGRFVLVLYWKVWNAVLPWFGRYALHARNPEGLRLPTAPILLGDFAGGYVLMLLFLLLGLAAAAVWMLAGRRRSEYRTAHDWLRVYVRYALACSMLGYALGKVFPLQFPPLGLVERLAPLGMLEPRRLLWDFMGFSRPYQVFTGLVECAGLALLFWRRTTLLGALILAAALTNVLMIDISYGMAVRRVALRLLLMALFLAAPDLRRMADLFLRNRPVAPGDCSAPAWKNPWVGRTALAVKAVVVLYLVGGKVIADAKDPRLAAAPRPALYGVYEVQRFSRNGRQVPTDDPRAWRWIAIDEHELGAQAAGPAWERRPVVFDDAAHTITLPAGPRRSSLDYSRAGADEVLMKGVLDNQPTEISLRRMPEPRFPLNDPRQVRWSSLW